MAAGDVLPPFALLLRRARQAAGLTQEALAERAHLSWRAISDLERGVNHHPRADTLVLLADALELAAPDRAAFEAAARHHATPSPPATIPPRRPNLPAQSESQPPFVGRAHELSILARHLAGEGPPLLLLAGEPGIGKSRLLSETAQRAADIEWQVLAGGCRRRGGQEPYAPLLQALEQHIQGQTDEALRSHLQSCAWMIHLLPELATAPIEPLPVWTLPPEQVQRLMVKAVRQYLTNVAGSAGTLLLLDDLQWAGEDVLNMLGVLLRVQAPAPLRVVGAYRDTELRPHDPLGALLADLVQAGLVAHHTLQPLSHEETAQLLDLLWQDGERAPVPLREQTLRQVGGIPFFVVSCAQELRLAPAEGAAYATPWSIRHSVRQRVAALPAAMQEVVDVTAVAGGVVQPSLLTLVTGQRDQDVAAALAEACRVRLLEEAEDVYRFAHGVIHEVVEAELPAAGRRLLHRKIAEALEGQPRAGTVAVLAYHCSRAGERAKAALYLEQAGDQALQVVAHAAAANQYREAAEHLDALGRAVEGARVRTKLGDVLISLGRYGEALAVLDRAAEVYRLNGDLEGLGLILAQGAPLHRSKERFEEAIAQMQAHQAQLRARGLTRGLGLVCARLAELLAWRGRYDLALASAEQSADVARAEGDERLLAMADTRRADALRNLGRYDEAQALYEAAIPLAEATGQLYSLHEALNDLAAIEVLRGNFVRCRELIDYSLAISERVGESNWIGYSIAHRAVTSFWSCDWVQARHDAEQALALAELQLPVFATLPHWALGQVRLGEGRQREAAEHLEECVRLARSSGIIVPERMAQCLLADLDLLQQRPRQARDRLLPYVDPASLGWKDSGFLVPRLAWAHLDLGELEPAAQLVEQAIGHARTKNDRLNLVEALRVSAMVAQRREQWEEAARHCRDALAVARGMGYSWGEGRVQYLYAQIHLQQGEIGPARARLEAARAIFQALGARAYLEWVEQTLASLAQ